MFIREIQDPHCLDAPYTSYRNTLSSLASQSSAPTCLSTVMFNFVSIKLSYVTQVFDKNTSLDVTVMVFFRCD